MTGVLMTNCFQIRLALFIYTIKPSDCANVTLEKLSAFLTEPKMDQRRRTNPSKGFAPNVNIYSEERLHLKALFQMQLVKLLLKPSGSVNLSPVDIMYIILYCIYGSAQSS